MFHVSALIDLAIERGEDVTRSISFRDLFSEGMACRKELYVQKQWERKQISILSFFLSHCVFVRCFRQSFTASHFWSIKSQKCQGVPPVPPHIMTLTTRPLKLPVRLLSPIHLHPQSQNNDSVSPLPPSLPTSPFSSSSLQSVSTITIF
jgi:hypothetical protein